MHLIARSRARSVDEQVLEALAQLDGRVLGAHHRRPDAVRGARPLGVPAPDHGTQEDRLRVRQRELRARPDRRPRPFHCRARRGAQDRRTASWKGCPASPVPNARRPASSSWSTSPAPTPASGRWPWTGPAGHSAGSWRANTRCGGLRVQRPRLLQLGRARLLRGERDPARAGPDPQPLRGPDLHPPDPARAGPGSPHQVQRRARGDRGPERGGHRRLAGPGDHECRADHPHPRGRCPRDPLPRGLTTRDPSLLSTASTCPPRRS